MDARQVESVVQEFTYQAQAFEVILAIEAGTAIASGRRHQSACLVEPEILGGIPDQTCRDRDAIHPS